MNVYFAIAWIVTLLVSGCAASPTASSTEPGRSAIIEEGVKVVPGTDQDVLILRQPGATKDQAALKRPGGKKPDRDASANLCPPGQLMAIRVVSGETGTRTTEECVTPFASMGQKYKRQQPVAIKLRNSGGSLKAKTVTRKQ
ncbi:MAG: hypothetical protein L0Y38_12150 [Methylococcaceae bacterium]|nr:hypothetical protein [Methylococcaceae bacterium]MCI0734549.1 hypothetical protein [Methylococcaceae bacterium]